MDPSIIIVIIIGFVVSLWLMYEIIKAGTMSKHIKSELKMQTDLMAKIAQKAGVSEDDIKKILSPPFK